jgi:hypothetical protein
MNVAALFACVVFAIIALAAISLSCAGRSDSEQ